MNTQLKLARLEGENTMLRDENARLTGIIEYIGAMDYPEILETEEHDDDLRISEEKLSSDLE